jgi:hypothetical protein
MVGGERLQHIATVHGDDRSRDVACTFAAQENDDVGDVLRIAEAVQHTAVARTIQHLG